MIKVIHHLIFAGAGLLTVVPALPAQRDTTRDTVLIARRDSLEKALEAVTSIDRKKISSSNFYVRTDVIRAGISSPFAETPQQITLEATQQGEVGRRVKHAAIGAGIGAGVGLVVGAAVGLSYDHNGGGDATFPATPFFAVEGLGIGLVAGLVIGAFVK